VNRKPCRTGVNHKNGKKTKNATTGDLKKVRGQKGQREKCAKRMRNPVALKEPKPFRRPSRNKRKAHETHVAACGFRLKKRKEKNSDRRRDHAKHLGPRE